MCFLLISLIYSLDNAVKQLSETCCTIGDIYAMASKYLSEYTKIFVLQEHSETFYRLLPDFLLFCLSTVYMEYLTKLQFLDYIQVLHIFVNLVMFLNITIS